MTTATTQASNTTTNNSNSKAKKPGRSYDLCRVEVQEDGTKKFHNIGTLFLRESGSGGVVYLRGAVVDGKKLPDTEVAVFPKKARS